MSRQRIVLTTAVAVVAFLSGGWFMQQGSRRDDNVYQRARLFDDVMSHIADYYVDPIDERQLYNMAISGMVNELHDPYSIFLTGRTLSGLSEATTGNYGGLGIQIEYRDNAIVVIAPLPDTPAERAGIITGDRIVQVDSQSTSQWNQDLAVRNLRGPVGSQVTLKVQRPGVTDVISFQLTRAEIHARSVRTALMVDGRVGYVELNPFSEASARELTAAIDSLKRAGMQSLILDLRGNPGGLLDEGIAVSSLFLEPGQEIVSTRGRAEGATREFTDNDAQRYPDLPIVVVVNGQSASASEIVAGALQDHDRALVIGTPTYGKGLVQTLFRLSNDAALKITTAKWYTPSGRSIQRQARNEQEQESQVDSAAVRADTAKPKPDQMFHTDHGRLVLGGGGIIPDVVIRPDSSTETAVRLLNAALGKNVAKYTDALAAYALDLRARHAVSSPTFELTPDMRAAFLALLARRGVTLDERTVTGAREFLDQQLGYEIAQFSFGRIGGNPPPVRRGSGAGAGGALRLQGPHAGGSPDARAERGHRTSAAPLGRVAAMKAARTRKPAGVPPLPAVGIIGPGRAGLGLALALRRARVAVAGVHGRHDKAMPAGVRLSVGPVPPWLGTAGVVVLAVRDDALAPLVGGPGAGRRGRARSGRAAPLGRPHARRARPARRRGRRNRVDASAHDGERRAGGGCAAFPRRGLFSRG